MSISKDIDQWIGDKTGLGEQGEGSDQDWRREVRIDKTTDENHDCVGTPASKETTWKNNADEQEEVRGQRIYQSRWR